jgi:hypothetical protein
MSEVLAEIPSRLCPSLSPDLPGDGSEILSREVDITIDLGEASIFVRSPGRAMIVQPSALNFEPSILCLDEASEHEPILLVLDWITHGGRLLPEVDALRTNGEGSPLPG